MNSFLITRPNYDRATRHLYFWCEELLQLAQKTWKVYELSKHKANQKNIENYLTKQKPSLVVFNGHGNAESVAGHNGQELISINKGNESLLAGKKVFIRACTAGRILGKSIKERGAEGFIGYKAPFVFWADPAKLSRPLEDLQAEPFRECSNQVAVTLLKGHSIRDAHNSNLATYRRVISKLLTSDSTRAHLVPLLIADMDNQVCYD